MDSFEKGGELDEVGPELELGEAWIRARCDVGRGNVSIGLLIAMICWLLRVGLLVPVAVECLLLLLLLWMGGVDGSGGNGPWIGGLS